jgi:putative flippase GtrA
MLATSRARTRPLSPTSRPASRRLRPSPAGQVVHFAGVGLVSTISFALLFALLYGSLGVLTADVVALGLCALGNLAANRRYTFAGSGPEGRRHYYSTGLLLSLLPLASTLLSLAALSAAGTSSLPVDLLVLTGVNLCSSIVRFRFLSASVAGTKQARAQ